VLQGRDEGQLDALARVVARLGRGEVLEPLVRIRLDPHGLHERRADLARRIHRWSVLDRQHALGAALDRRQARVRGDPVQPRAHRAAALELRQPAPGAQQRLLHGVLGVLHGAEHPIAVRVQLATMGFDEAQIGRFVDGCAHV
jgi:hypothetical protein